MEKKMENEMETREYVGNTREYYMDFLTRVVNAEASALLNFALKTLGLIFMALGSIVTLIVSW